MKRCSKCKIEKSLEDYHKDNRNKDGRRIICKECIKNYKKIYYEKNKNEILSFMKDYGIKNREIILEKKKEYCKNNKEKIKNYNTKYYKENKEILIEKNKDYYYYNIEKMTMYHKEYNDKNYKENKEKVLNISREYYKNNKEKEKNRHHIYYENNKEKLVESTKKYRDNNIDKVREYHKRYNLEYKLKNKEKIKEFKKNWEERNKHIVLWRSLLKRVTRYFGQEKTNSTYNMLGYSSVELKNHLEKLFTKEMNWSNYGEWHVDHIKPLYTFDKKTPPSIVNSLSNLRPLWAKNKEIDGIIYEGNFNRKRNKYNYEKI